MIHIKSIFFDKALRKSKHKEINQEATCGEVEKNIKENTSNIKMLSYGKKS